MTATIANAVAKSNSICDFTCFAFQQRIREMDEEEEKQIRWELLVALIKDAGGNTAFRDKYQRPDLKEGDEISVTFISQLKNKSRSFGYTAARNIEELSTLPKFYFDPWRKDSELVKPEISEFSSKKELLRTKLKEMIDSTDDEETLIQTAGFLGFINSTNKKPEDDGNEKPKKRGTKK